GEADLVSDAVLHVAVSGEARHGIRGHRARRVGAGGGAHLGPGNAIGDEGGERLHAERLRDERVDAALERVVAHRGACIRGDDDDRHLGMARAVAEEPVGVEAREPAQMQVEQDAGGVDLLDRRHHVVDRVGVDVDEGVAAGAEVGAQEVGDVVLVLDHEDRAAGVQPGGDGTRSCRLSHAGTFATRWERVSLSSTTTTLSSTTSCSTSESSALNPWYTATTSFRSMRLSHSILTPC